MCGCFGNMYACIYCVLYCSVTTQLQLVNTIKIIIIPKPSDTLQNVEVFISASKPKTSMYYDLL